MKRLVVLIACLLCLPNCTARAAAPDTGQVVASSSDESVAQDLIYKRVKTAIDVDDFAILSAMEDDFRSSRARTPSGIWKLAAFHGALQAYLADGLQHDSGCKYRRSDFVQRWTSAFPHNPAPVITDAALLLKRAWCFRGQGYATTVTEQAWPEVRKSMAAADEVLERNKATSSTDPEYYAVKLNIMILQGASKAIFHAVIEEATAREPYYHRTYFNASFYYLPQWGGSDAEVEAFARYAAERTRAGEHSGFYARVFWSLDECGCGFLEQAADWPRMKQAMRDVYERYPVRWNGQYFADLACRRGDVEEGRRYIRAIHPDGSGDVYFIGLFATCDYHQRMGK